MPPVVPRIFWPGSGSNPDGITAQGLYDDDPQFQDDAPKIADWVCSTMGYPMFDIELTDKNIYDNLEYAITEYGALVNEFNMRENMLSLQGAPTSQNISQRLIKGSPLNMIAELSAQYGTAASVGGNVDFKRGYFILSQSVQDYDLQQLIGGQFEGGNRIEIQRIFNENPPAISRIFDPFAQAGLGLTNVMSEFGWGGMSIPTQFLLTPVFENLLRIQAIEFNDLVRRSSYGFELKNNKIRIFPIPDGAMDQTRMWIEYLVVNDKFAPANLLAADTGSVSDFSNVPYTNIQYSYINDVGKQWIRNITLARCKITLGMVRSKYSNMPIPNNVLELDGLVLRQEGERELQILYENFRESLKEAGKSSQLEKADKNFQSEMNILRGAPILIYIG